MSAEQEHLCWDLTRETHAELSAELRDHLASAAESGERPEIVTRLTALQKVQNFRRRLAGAHLADQVYATLHRKPDRREWLELLWFLLWYAGVGLSDALAVTVDRNYDVPVWWTTAIGSIDPNVRIEIAWLLRAVCLAGFYTSLISSLVHAWRRGNGVLIARLLQLKLLHTLFVIGILAVLGEALWQSYFRPWPREIFWPLQVNAIGIAVACLCAAAVTTLVLRHRGWAVATWLLWSAVFLYSGAPTIAHYAEAGTSLGAKLVEYGGKRVRVPSSDPVDIALAAKAWETPLGDDWGRPKARLDVPNNRVWTRQDILPNTWGTYFAHELTKQSSDLRNTVMTISGWRYRSNEVPGYSWPHEEVVGRPYLVTPVAAPGGGLGWLAAPIPLLGLAGLVGLLLVMGRRSTVDAAVYLLLCVAAFGTTVLPFTYSGQAGGELYAFNAEGMVIGPLPGFEALLTGPNFGDEGLIVLALILSAGVPWLLTALFLRPRTGTGLTELREEQ